MKRYSKNHIWVEATNGVYTVGVSSYAMGLLGDLTCVELPRVGHVYQVGDWMGSVESFKSVNEVTCPITGKVVEVNEKVVKEPGLVGLSPERDGWFARFSEVKPETFEALLSAEDYQTLIKGNK